MPTTVPATVAAPSATDVVLPGLPIAEPLPAGTSYRIGRAVLGRGIQITNPVEGAWPQWDTGGFVLTASADASQLLIAAVELTKARVFTDPLVDAYSLLDVDALTAATSEPPADFLAFFAALPGIEAGEVTDTEFAGQPARAISWTFGAFEGGSPCRPSGNCVNTVWFPGTRRDGGWISSYTSGDAGTTYVLDFDGQIVIFEVQDRPGAQEAADSLGHRRLSAHQPTDAGPRPAASIRAEDAARRRAAMPQRRTIDGCSCDRRSARLRRPHP